MSSSNRVRIATIAETTYGVTPGAGNFKKSRFVSESLSGTPETQESQLIRDDRQSSGQVNTGLTVGGDIVTEIAKDDQIDEFLESAMFDTWNTSAPVSVDLTYASAGKTLTRTAGDWNADVRKGDILTLTNFVNSENNTEVMVASIDSTTVLTLVVPDGMVDEVGSGTDYQLADYLEISTTKKSFSMEKAFLDLTDKAINYTGQLIGNMVLNVAYGEISSATFSFSGNGYDPVDASGDFLTDGRTIDPAATTNSMNGSVDMPFLANDAGGTFIDSPFCIQSIELTLNNNLTPQTCIGEVAPKDYSEGTGLVTANLNAYYEDTNHNLLDKKLTQDPFAVGYMIKNSGGFYGVFIPALQASFSDPASAGQNQDVFINASATAKIGAAGEKALRIFRG